MRPLAGFELQHVVDLVVVIIAHDDHPGPPFIIGIKFVTDRDRIEHFHIFQPLNGFEPDGGVLVNTRGEKHVDVRGNIILV